jgi:hypothetical protein
MDWNLGRTADFAKRERHSIGPLRDALPDWRQFVWIAKDLQAG